MGLGNVASLVYAVHIVFDRAHEADERVTTRMIDELRDGRAGTAVLPGDTDWGANPPIYPPPGDPVAVVRPETPEQVGEALRFAAAEGIGVGIRSGGHGGANYDNDGGLVIELSNFTKVDVDGTTVRVGGGAVWGDVAAELAKRDLGLTSGDTKSVGVGGLTLGGGVGWMVREHGLALDSLIAAEVVLPSGEVVTATADEHADLFWALRGGGGNFGVVTTFVFRAHPLDGVVFGTLSYAVDGAADVMKGWRDVMRDAPEKFNSTFLVMPAMGPGMEAAAQIIVFHPGRVVAAAEPQLERLRVLPGLRGEDIAAKDYAEALDDPHPFEGEPPVITGDNGFAPDLNDATVDALVAAHASLDAGVLMVRYLRGAFNRVPADATAWAFRDAEAMLMLAAFLPPKSPQELIDGVHAKWKPVLSFTTGTYGNFAQSAGADMTALIYPPKTLARLREVKRTYDPQNLLHANHNVVP
jgi:FAD/FMN-containing dehydrogenase